MASKIVINNLDGVLFHDRLLHNRGHLLRYMKELDSCETPFAYGFDDVIGCHVHSLYASDLIIYLDDYPYPFVTLQTIQLSGTFVYTSTNRVPKFSFDQQASLYGNTVYNNVPTTILRCSVGMRFFQNFIMQVSNAAMSYGPAITIMRQLFSCSFGNLTSKSVSRSPKLPWFDRLRFIVQGPFEFQVYDTCQVRYFVRSAYEPDDCFIVSAEGFDIQFIGKGDVLFTSDVFSFIVSQVQDNVHKYTPIYEGSYIKCDIVMKWGAELPYEHYVELLPGASDEVDKFSTFRSHQLRWKVHIYYDNTKLSQALIFLRGELLQWLKEFYDILNSPSDDLDIGLMRMTQRYDIEWNMKNVQYWMYIWSLSLFLRMLRFIDDQSTTGLQGKVNLTTITTHLRKYFGKYFELIGKEDQEQKDPDYEYEYPGMMF